MSNQSQSRKSTERIIQLSVGSHGILTRASLLEAGFNSRFIDGRIRSGWLRPVYPGVYSVGAAADSTEALLMAGLEAAGADAFLASQSAGVAWGFLKPSRCIEVIRPESRKPSVFRIGRPGAVRSMRVVVRRSSRLEAVDLARLGSFRVTSVARTLLDLAGSMSPRRFRSAFNEADRLGLLDADELFRCASRGKGWAGVGKLQRLVEIRHPDMISTESELEAMFLELCQRAGIPNPEVNAPLFGYRVDCLWPARRLVVELDGFRFHAGRMAAERDASRDNDLRLRGFEVIRFTYDMVAGRPEKVVQLLHQTLTAPPPDLPSGRVRRL